MSRPDQRTETGGIGGCPHSVIVRADQELAVLAGLLGRTRSGDPGVVLLEGPVGIGKTLLLRQLAGQARQQGVRVFEAPCDTLDDRPFAMVRRLFEPLRASGNEQERALLLGGHAAAARQALDVPAEPGAPANAAEDMSYTVLHGLYRFTAHLAEREPLVLIVDDAQNADFASLRFLVHLARRMAGLPVLLAVARTGGTAEGALLDELAAQPLCKVVRPRPLSAADVAQVVRGVMGTEADEDFHAACLTATGGNPLLLQTLLAALRFHGKPPTVTSLKRAHAQDTTLFSDAILRVLWQQPAATMAAARAMAVLGDDMAPETCARLAGLDTSTLDSALRTLGAIGLVRSIQEGRTWAFNHDMVKEAVLSDMTPAQRAGAHREAARLLVVGGARAEQVAGHLLLTDPSAIEEWAVTVLQEAAREASSRGDSAVAVDILRHCLRQDADPATDTERLVELGLAEAAVDVRASIEHLELALEHVQEPSRRFSVLTSLSEGLARDGQAARAVGLLTAHAGSVWDADGEFARLLEAQRLLTSYGDLDSYRGVMAGSPFDLELPGGTPGERALLAARSGLTVVGAHRVAEASAAARRALEQRIPSDDSPAQLIAAATTLLYADRPDEAEHLCRRVSGATGQDSAAPAMAALRAETYYRQGALARALAATEAAMGPAPSGEAADVCVLPLATRVHTLLEYGDLPGAEAVASRTFGSGGTKSWRWNEYLCARGRMHLARQMPETALVDLQDCGRRQEKWARTNPAVSSWWFWAGHAHLALGAADAARELAERAIERARESGLPCALGMGLVLRAATVDGAEGLALLEEAVSVLDDSPARLELTRALVAYGRALHEAGRTPAAREVLRRALESAYAQGAQVLRGQAHTALVATGARPRRAASSGLGSLTSSEAQVARFAATGRSNLEIAEALFVTQRTIELHLTSVYRKLGLSGRRELGRALRESG